MLILLSFEKSRIKLIKYEPNGSNMFYPSRLIIHDSKDDIRKLNVEFPRSNPYSWSSKIVSRIVRSVHTTIIMSHDHWNDDIAYVFSTHRALMQILGIWPLQKKTMFTTMQWSLTTFLMVCKQQEKRNYRSQLHQINMTITQFFKI